MNGPSSLIIALTLLGGTASALALRHDAGEQPYLELGAQFPSVVQVGEFGTGTLVARDWVLTAAHVPEMMQRMLRGAPLTVSVAGETYEVERVAVPEARTKARAKESTKERTKESEAHDIALLKLKKPVPVELTPLTLWKKELAVGTKFALAGWGILAMGDAGIKVSPEAMKSPTRKLRAGWNEIDRVDTAKGVLRADFDGPEKGVELEAGPCIGDSGGPLLIRVEGQDAAPATWHIGGVVAHVDDVDEDHIIGEYGDEFALTPVFAYADWIEATIKP